MTHGLQLPAPHQCAPLSILAVSLLLAACSQEGEQPAQGPIPREILFDASLPKHVRISPKGGWVTFVSNYRGAPNIWLKPVDPVDQPRPITAYPYPGVGPHVWHPSGEYILFTRQMPASDDVKPYALHLRSLTARAVLGEAGQQGRFLAYSRALPDTLYAITNARQPGQMDIYRVDLATGARLLVHRDEMGASGYFAGPDLAPLIAQVPGPDGGFEWRIQDDAGDWQLWGSVGVGDAMTTRIENVSTDAQTVYVASSIGRDTTALYAAPVDAPFDPQTADLLAAQERYDYVHATYHAGTQVPFVAEFASPRPSWVPLSADFTTALLGMRASGSGQLRFGDAAAEAGRWVIAHETTAAPPTWGVYDVEQSVKQPIKPDLDRFLAMMGGQVTRPVVLSSIPEQLDSAKSEQSQSTQSMAVSDALVRKVSMGPDLGAVDPQDRPLEGYLTLPPLVARDNMGALGEPIPMVIVLRGDIFGREGWAYRPLHQWLASRGVGALSLRHRGLAGQGKAALIEGDAPLPQRIADDIARAADWLVDRNMVRPGELAFQASGLGAAAVLEYLARPGASAACVGMASPLLDPSQLYASLPGAMAPIGALLKATAKLAAKRAPLPKQTTKIMIAHGAQNRRQTLDMVRSWARDAKSAGHTVSLVVPNQAQESFDRSSDSRAVMAAMEMFMASCLTMEAEPLTEADFLFADMSYPMLSADLAEVKTLTQSAAVSLSLGQILTSQN